MPGGRPAAFDDADQQMFCSLVGLGLSIDTAAHCLGYASITARRALRKKPGFLEKYHNARIGNYANSLMTLQKAAKSDWRAASWTVERLLPEHFAKRRTDLTVQAAQVMYQEAVAQIRAVLPKGKLRRRVTQRLLQLESLWYRDLTQGGSLAKDSRVKHPKPHFRKPKRLSQKSKLAKSSDPQATPPGIADQNEPVTGTLHPETATNCAQTDLNST